VSPFFVSLSLCLSPSIILLLLHPGGVKERICIKFSLRHHLFFCPRVYLLLYTPSTIFEPYNVRRTYLSKANNRFSLLLVTTHVSLPYSMTGGSRSCRSLTLSDVPGEMITDVFARRRSTYLRFGFFAVSPNPLWSSYLFLLLLPSVLGWRKVTFE
jgi:hypothetical protein